MLLVPAGNPSEWTGPTGNNTFLLRGAVPTLVDAGVGEQAHVAAVARALGGDGLAAVLVTHNHPDHVQGLTALLERWPRAAVRNVPPDAVRDGERIRAGDTVLRAVATPGHAPDHVCFLDETTRDLYCGDLARLGGTVVIPALSGGNLALYLASLRAVRALGPRRLLPGHGPIVNDPARLIDEYLAHREERERQVVDALRRGLTTPERIARDVYRDLPTGSPLLRAAADTVLAHLLKLRDDGAAVETGGAWRMV